MVQSNPWTVKDDFGRPGFRRLLDEVRKRYVSAGKVGRNVRVRLSGLTPEECELIGGFLGRYLRPGDSLTVSLKTVEEELRRTRYGLTLPELFEALEGRPLLTRTEQAEQEERRWKGIFREVRERTPADRYAPIAGWLSRLECGRASGYRTFCDLYRDLGDRAAEPLRLCVEALCRLEAGEVFPRAPRAGRVLSSVRLPVLAAHVTGDSHAFDLKYPLGRLLWHALNEIREDSGERDKAAAMAEAPDSETLAVRETYRRSGVRDDDLSSQVIVWGRPFTAGMEPSVLTLRQVETLDAWPTVSALYAVENPSVFSTLLDAMNEAGLSNENGFSPLLICVNGQPDAAVILFMERCLAQNPSVKLYYSGDFDVAGLQIADGLAARFPEAFVPWRMDAATYRRWAGNGPAFSNEENERLAKLKPAWEPGLGQVLREVGKKCYQELLIGDLLDDWLGGWERTR